MLQLVLEAPPQVSVLEVPHPVLAPSQYWFIFELSFDTHLVGFGLAYPD